MLSTEASSGHRLWRIRSNVYSFLEQRTGRWNMLFHMVVFGYVLLALGLSSLLTEEDEINRTPLQRLVYIVEVTLAIYFTTEFLLRLWAVGADARYQGFYGRLRFLGRFVCLVDLIILGATMMLLALSSEQGRAFGPGMVQHVRLLQMFRLLHFDRQMSTWRIIRDMIRMSKFELVSAYYITFLIFLALSSSVFIAESFHYKQLKKAAGNETDDISPTFDSFGDSMWFAIISLLTIGYGDIVPKAWVSKILTCILGFCAFCTFTTSSTLIGVGLTLMVQDRNKEKLRQKVRGHAARVLQTWYRRHLLNTNKYKEIRFFRDTLFRRLHMYEKMIIRQAEMAALQRLKGRRSSGSGLLAQSLLKQMRKKSVFELLRNSESSDSSLDLRMNTVSTLLQQSEMLSGAAAPAHDRRSLSVAAPLGAPGRKFSLVERMSMFYNKSTAHADKHHHDVETGKSAVDNSQFYYSSAPPSATFASTDSPVGSTPPIVVHSDETDKACSSAVSSRSQTPVHTPAHTPDRSRANSVDTVATVDVHSRHASIASIADDWHDAINDRALRKYGILMQFIYYLRFLANKSRFNRARKPFEEKDIETELLEMESQRMNKLKELELSMERAIGSPLCSPLSIEKSRLSLARRLELCEHKLETIERNTQLVQQLSEAIAKQQLASSNTSSSLLRVSSQNQRTRPAVQRRNAFMVKVDSANPL